MNGKAADERWEKRLNISTGAANHEKDDANHSRYEPTSYAVLERLAESGRIGRDDTLVDYGCGKGRVSLFLSHATGCRSIGVEYDPLLHAQAQENLAGYAGRRDRVRFVCENAEIFDAAGADCFYFFNPFPVKILRAVMGRILDSYYAAPRRLTLFFYYALDDHLAYLMAESGLQYAGAIDCRDLFHNADEREKIHIFVTE